MLLSTHPEESAIKQRSSTILNDPQQPSNAVLSDPIVNSDHKPLQARLSLKFAEIDGTTRLVEREHFGPLLVQKPFYPEDRKICHVVIIHPPGGVVGGDQLAITAQVGASANAQITTPGAAKWYKANGHTSQQKIRINVSKGGALEWVPQETIFYNNANVEIDHQVTLEEDALYVGCEILCFGRTAFGETFNSGQIKQRTRILRNGKMIWLEQIRLQGESSAMSGALTLSGKTVCATLILTGKTIPQPLIDLAREEAAKITKDVGQIGISQLKSIVAVRYLGNSSEVARHVMLRVWGLFRPEMLGRAEIVPRMWNT
ncbi:urease accessory protein UreD [Nitrosomonas supralitoralis]|uniref:Urease accessory protein UreD n=1 Tax=Nitrosomonas supralitoralis TaxID=2116706 RepID=A0A2P7NWW1_9PROT|nr:urease accessory protein UreD [Nitrosomonas supralitoralis]PSJ17915.1 urease accessory protein [Nitrosomonas supralitoralis]